MKARKEGAGCRRERRQPGGPEREGVQARRTAQVRPVEEWMRVVRAGEVTPFPIFTHDDIAPVFAPEAA